MNAGRGHRVNVASQRFAARAPETRGIEGGGAPVHHATPHHLPTDTKSH